MSTLSISSASSADSTLSVYRPARLEKRRRRWLRFRTLRRILREYGMGIVAAIILVLIVGAVFFAEHLTPHDPTAGMNLSSRFMPPAWEMGGTWEYPLGTDNLGRDVLTRTLHGGQVSLQVAFIASTVSMLIGVVYGLLSGYVGGSLDRMLMRITDVWVSFPFMVLALAVIAAVGSTPLVLVALLSLAGWVYPARMTRAQTLKTRQMEFVQASHSMGAPPSHIIRYHIVPYVLSVNIVLWTLSLGTLILIESSLSFIGLGVSPPTPSWGNMLSDSKTYLQDAWWMSIVPGATLMLTILCVNTVGDALQRLVLRGETLT